MSDQSDRLGMVTRLAMSKNATQTVSAEQLVVYAEDLADVPVELLRESCRRLSRAATFGYPSVGDIRLMVDTVQREQIAKVKALPAPYDDEANRRGWVHCRECNDDPAAWLPPMWCQGQGHGFISAVNALLKISTCGNPKSHAPHSFTERCVCYMAAWRNARRMQSYGENTRETARTR